MGRAECEAVCRLIDRDGRVNPLEEDWQHHTVVGMPNESFLPNPSISLSEVAILDELRACMLRAVYDLTQQRLVLDGTLLKKAGPGHQKNAHLDTAEHPHRIATCIMYLNNCDTGALKVGAYDHVL